MMHLREVVLGENWSWARTALIQSKIFLESQSKKISFYYDILLLQTCLISIVKFSNNCMCILIIFLFHSHIVEQKY